jgi:hypothetical protein
MDQFGVPWHAPATEMKERVTLAREFGGPAPQLT